MFFRREQHQGPANEPNQISDAATTDGQPRRRGRPATADPGGAPWNDESRSPGAAGRVNPPPATQAAWTRRRGDELALDQRDKIGITSEQ